MFFPNPSQRAFLDGQGANRCSQVRFWNHFKSKRVPKIAPLGAVFGPKGAKCRVPQLAGSALGPTWSWFGAENDPRTYFHRSGIDFWQILEGIRTIFECFLMLLVICQCFVHNTYVSFFTVGSMVCQWFVNDLLMICSLFVGDKLDIAFWLNFWCKTSNMLHGSPYPNGICGYL